MLDRHLCQQCRQRSVAYVLQACASSGGGLAARFLYSLVGPPKLAYLWEHRVRGRALFPGAAMFEAAYAAGAALLGAHAASADGADPSHCLSRSLPRRPSCRGRYGTASKATAAYRVLEHCRRKRRSMTVLWLCWQRLIMRTAAATGDDARPALGVCGVTIPAPLLLPSPASAGLDTSSSRTSVCLIDVTHSGSLILRESSVSRCASCTGPPTATSNSLAII